MTEINETVAPHVSAIEVCEVTKKSQLRKFVNFPNKLYKKEPNFVPAFYGDDLADWDREKNPAFEYCEAKCFLAYRNGIIVGRIGAILNHASNEKWLTNRMRFSQVDFIDDYDVSSALFAAVENWAREKGCTEVHGPLGFCDMDREGMLVEGYDKRSMFITYYNYPYYNEHLARLGYVKDIDWIEYKIFAPDNDAREAQIMHRVAERMKNHLGLHVAELHSKSQYGKYVEQVFNLVNKAYSPLYGVVKLNDRQIKKYKNKFAPLINPAFACFVMDKDEKMVAFGVSAPSMAEAMKKSRGRLFPFGWIGVLKALRHNDALDMFLIAVDPEMQGLGLNAIILDHMIQNGVKLGVKYAETGPQLETNCKILAQWKMFPKEQHKRRRCYVKSI